MQWGGSYLACAVLGAVFAVGGAVADPADPVDRLVGRVYFEGLPYADARALGPAASERLITLLRDAERAEHHANAVLVLGILGAPGTYEALLEWADGLGTGEVDRAGFRARRALPHAMGHLARSDARALAWLSDRAQRGDAPGWSFGPLREERLVALQRRAAIEGLALSASPSARIELERLAERPDVAGDPQLARGVQEALALHALVQRDGLEAALPGAGATR